VEYVGADYEIRTKQSTQTTVADHTKSRTTKAKASTTCLSSATCLI